MILINILHSKGLGGSIGNMDLKNVGHVMHSQAL